jgi:DME family drug/metabolite transporter
MKSELQHKDTSAITGYAAVITAAAFWGGSGVFVKLIADHATVSATALAFWRDVTTFICLLLAGLAAIPGKIRLQRSDWRIMAGMGANLGLFHIFYNAGIMLNGAAVTTVQQAVMPAIVTISARFLWQEKLTGPKILALLSTFAGTLLVAGLADLKTSGFTISGLLIGFCVPCLYAAWNLFGKKLRMQYEAMVVLIFAFGIASALLLPLQFFIAQPWPVPPLAWLWFAGLIGISSLAAFFLYAVGIGRLQASIASILLMSEIAFAVFYAYLFLGERMTMSQIAGTILVVGGVLQLLRRNQRRKIMSQRAEALAKRFKTFNNEIIEFVESCPEEDWTKVCSGENWPVGVVARHVAAGHYRVLGLAQLIVEGKQLPELSREGIDQANARHAEKHAGCTKEEVLGLLRKNGSAITDYVAGLEDADLDRAGHLPIAGGATSTQQIIENLIIQSAGEHLASLKSATGR